MCIQGALDLLMPSYAHVAVTKLLEDGVFKFIVSSNHDNMHIRSGNDVPPPLCSRDGLLECVLNWANTVDETQAHSRTRCLRYLGTVT